MAGLLLHAGRWSHATTPLRQTTPCTDGKARKGYPFRLDGGFWAARCNPPAQWLRLNETTFSNVRWVKHAIHKKREHPALTAPSIQCLNSIKTKEHQR
jgi:hypothetical protein